MALNPISQNYQNLLKNSLQSHYNDIDSKENYNLELFEKTTKNIPNSDEIEKKDEIYENYYENFPNNEQEVFENDSEDEGIEDYKPGGYHSVYIGEILNERYVIIQKLGWGHFSTVWLAKDFKFSNYVAIKIQKCSPNYMEAAFDEVEILQKVAKESCGDINSPRIVQMLNAFVHFNEYNPKEGHFCMVFEIMGQNLLYFIKLYRYQGVPIVLAKKMARDVLIGLDFLHTKCKVIHTDLKPENVLCCLTAKEIVLFFLLIVRKKL